MQQSVRFLHRGIGSALLALTALVLTSSESELGGRNGQPRHSLEEPPAGSFAACETIRQNIRTQAVQALGFDVMVERMKRISRELSIRERYDLRQLTTAIGAEETEPGLQARSAKRIKAIYSQAIERAGLALGVPEVRKDLNRTITVDPSGSDPLVDGYTVVLSSASAATQTTPTVGEITEAFLAANADQSRYEMILVRAQDVVPGPNQGFEIDGEYITMHQYVHSKQPPHCAPIGSRQAVEQINRI